MNEVTNLVLLYHVMSFTDFVGEPGFRHGLGWSFILFLTANLLVHLVLLIRETYFSFKEAKQNGWKKKVRKVKGKTKTKASRAKAKAEAGAEARTGVGAEGESQEDSEEELSIIIEEEAELVSNFSKPDTVRRKAIEKVSDSDWQSKFGDTEHGGYRLENIRWSDLGRKYIVKKKKSMWADIDESALQNKFHTIDDRFMDSKPELPHIETAEQELILR